MALGSDRVKTGLVCWRRVDLKAVIEDRFSVVYNERSVSHLLGNWKQDTAETALASCICWDRSTIAD